MLRNLTFLLTSDIFMAFLRAFHAFCIRLFYVQMVVYIRRYRRYIIAAAFMASRLFHIAVVKRHTMSVCLYCSISSAFSGG